MLCLVVNVWVLQVGKRDIKTTDISLSQAIFACTLSLIYGQTSLHQLQSVILVQTRDYCHLHETICNSFITGLSSPLTQQLEPCFYNYSKHIINIHRLDMQFHVTCKGQNANLYNYKTLTCMIIVQHNAGLKKTPTFYTEIIFIYPQHVRK